MNRWSVIAIYTVAFWLLLPALLVLPHLLWRQAPAMGGQPFTTIAGALLAAIGVAICGWGIGHLSQRGRGLPISHLPPHEFVTTGPYAFVRHPIYLGYGLALLGAALLLGSAPMLAVSLPGFTIGAWLYTGREERVLIKRFGARYRHYRQLTPRLLPGRFALLTIAGWAASTPFRFRVIREAPVPDGGFVVVCPHNNYLDPGFLALALGRPAHFLVTYDMYRTKALEGLFSALGSVRVDRYRNTPSAVRSVRRIVAGGGIVVLFPEGGRSWFGEGSYPAGLPHFLAGLKVPMLPASVDGAYLSWPRWGRLALRPITMRLGRPRSIESAEVFHRTYAALRQRTFAAGSRRPMPMCAKGIEKILYCCASCGAFGSIGTAGARVACGSCRAVWTFEGDCRLALAATAVTLPEWHRAALRWLRQAGTMTADVDWHSEQGTKDRDVIRGPSTLTADKNRIAIRAKSGIETTALEYGQIDAVLVRSNNALQVYGHGTLHTVRFEDGRAFLFQELLRLRAFGNVYQRRREQEVVVT